MEPLCLYPIVLSADRDSSSEYLAVVLGQESIRAWGAWALMQCGQLGSLPSAHHSGPCSASLRGTGQGTASLRFTFCSQTWTAIFAPHNYLEWGLKPSQLMSPRLLLSLCPTPLTCKLQLAKCQQKLLLLPMRWITLAVKIISDVLLRCLMGLLFKHGWCKISPRHYSQQFTEPHLMSIFRIE